MSFGQSFTSSFEKSAATAGSGAISLIKEKREKAEKQLSIANRIASAVKIAEQFGGQEIGDKIASIASEIKTEDSANLLEELIKSQVKNDLELQGFKGLAKKAEQATAIAQAEELGILPQGSTPQIDMASFGVSPSTQTVQNNISMASQNQAQPSEGAQSLRSELDKSLGSGPLAQKAKIDILKSAEEDKMKSKIKMEEKKLEKIADLEGSTKSTMRFMQQFSRSLDELKSFDPKIEEEGFSGFMARRGGEIANFFDELPQTKALNIFVRPLANQMARDMEGGKITDQDRMIFVDSFANGLKNPTSGNVRLMSLSYINYLDKGANENGAVVKNLRALAKSNTDIFNRVIEQILVEYPELVTDIYGEDFEVQE